MESKKASSKSKICIYIYFTILKFLFRRSLETSLESFREKRKRKPSQLLSVQIQPSPPNELEGKDSFWIVLTEFFSGKPPSRSYDVPLAFISMELAESGLTQPLKGTQGERRTALTPRVPLSCVHKHGVPALSPGRCLMFSNCLRIIFTRSARGQDLGWLLPVYARVSTTPTFLSRLPDFPYSRWSCTRVPRRGRCGFQKLIVLIVRLASCFDYTHHFDFDNSGWFFDRHWFGENVRSIPDSLLASANIFFSLFFPRIVHSFHFLTQETSLIWMERNRKFCDRDGNLRN